MKNLAKSSLVLTLIAAMLLLPLGSAVMAQDRSVKEGEMSSGKMVADLLLVRPAGIVATLFGSVVFILASPFSALGGNFRESFDQLMVAPARYTFKRPLGDL